MTKKLCPNCKHTRGIGFDFWCGEGHTEYEVFGAETNCPYYESRTGKQFTVEKNNKYIAILDKGKNIGNTYHVCALLNAQYEEIQQSKVLIKKYHNENTDLIKENEQLKHEINYLENRLDDCVCLKKENKDLKEENLELSQKILKGLFEDENDELRKENKKLKEELEWCRMTVDGLKG